MLLLKQNHDHTILAMVLRWKIPYLGLLNWLKMLKYFSSGYGVLLDACGTLSLPSGCFGKKKIWEKKREKMMNVLIIDSWMYSCIYLLIYLFLCLGSYCSLSLFFI